MVAQEERSRDWVSIRRPFAKAGLETMTARYIQQSFKPHAHDEYVIGIIESGVHSVWCRGIHKNVPSGTVVTMHPGDVHYGNAAIAEGWKQRMIYISENEIRKFICDTAGGDKFLLPDFKQTFHDRLDLAHSFAQFHEVLHNSPLALARDVALDSIMRVTIGALSPDFVKGKDTKQPSGRIADAVEFLHNRIEDDVTLDELCDVAGLRRRQTIEAFKRCTGLPPHAYHVIQKVKAVKTMLRSGLSATEAAARAGFADQSHMPRHFVGVVGMTPGAYALDCQKKY
ncbi:AraC family transcriptional regulator [Agrobacterium vitis]|uniref:AraC family transcriptional regulator n=1 Tax=Agrobacterium vitis TaxID=373 RepID=UPI002035E47E|nr:AraC family transcriptional regulator [Agrobacterium vitis]MCM2453546.1 AraC family transcriptional regulator [Agrobacterium vitis]